jgi:predicted transcriptional regulator YdeE
MTMEVQTLERNETKLIGYTVMASLKQDLEQGIVGNLRQELLGKRHKIANQLNDTGIYLIQVYPDCEWSEDVPFESIVAVEVSDFSSPFPEGMIAHTIPAGTYVKVTHKGPESQIGDTYDAIREQDICSVRPFDFEHWVDVDSLDQEESTIDIYLPLEG